MGMYTRAQVIHHGGTQLPSAVIGGYYSPGALSVLKRSNQVKEYQLKNVYTLSQVNGFFTAYEEMAQNIMAKNIMAHYDENFHGFDTLVIFTF